MTAPIRHPFRLVALPSEAFDALRALDEGGLRARGARRMRADEKPGFPCRVSLVDAEPGEDVILLPFTHHEVDTPYRSSGPIFVRVEAKTAHPGINEVPEMIRSRLLSVRAYDSQGMMVGSEIVEGRDLETHIERVFSDPSIEYLDLHNARPGCYNCRVVRA